MLKSRKALALTWACEKFRDYLIGLTFDLETDHKPLLSLFAKKNWDELSPRIQRFRMRLAWYDYNVKFVSGKTWLFCLTSVSGMRKHPRLAFFEVLHWRLLATAVELCAAHKDNEAERQVLTRCGILVLVYSSQWIGLETLAYSLQPIRRCLNVKIIPGAWLLANGHPRRGWVKVRETYTCWTTSVSP